MKTVLLYAVTLAFCLATCGTASADYSDSSTDSGTFDQGQDFSSSIFVSVNQLIIDLTVTVNVEHSYVGDVTATLTHDNSGTSIELIPTAIPVIESDNLGDDPNNDDDLIPAPYRFIDTATETIGTAAQSGTFNTEIPAGDYLASDGTATGAGSLAATFSGLSTSGNWTILFTDENLDDDGTVDGWSISFTSVPEPSSLALIGLLGMAAIVRRRR